MAEDHTLDDLEAFNARMAKMPARRAELILEARAAQHTWPEIAERLGMTVHGAIRASRPSGPQGRPKAEP
jgi:DNA-directed RNA polymerase specialized sigma24 family protein